MPVAQASREAFGRLRSTSPKEHPVYKFLKSAGTGSAGYTTARSRDHGQADQHDHPADLRAPPGGRGGFGGEAQGRAVRRRGFALAHRVGDRREEVRPVRTLLEALVTYAVVFGIFDLLLLVYRLRYWVGS